MKLTQDMIDQIQELMNHTKKDGSTNWIDGEDIKISLAGTFAADRFIVIANESKKLLSRFTCQNYNLKYYIALEPDSTFE